MPTIEKYLGRLKEEKQRFLTAVEKPKDKTEFGFGQLSGQLLGLSRAEQLLVEILEDEKNDDKGQ